MIHVALVSAYPTEADARTQIVAGLQPLEDTPYLGIWTMPLPYGGRVHVFADETADRLEAAGWTREERP